MSNALNCTSCGGSNQLPEGKTSMFCSFCGNTIEQITSSQKEIESNLKTKPEITPRKVKTTKTTIDGDGVYNIGVKDRIRKDGGWDVYDGFLWKFIRDQEIEEEDVLDEGGVLNLSNRSIKSLNEIIIWFSNTELESIRTLILANNKISDLKGIENFKKTREISLDNNLVSELPSQLNFSGKIILTNNPIVEKSQTSKLETPLNVILESIPNCKQCGAARTPKEYAMMKRKGEPTICGTCRINNKISRNESEINKMVSENPRLKASFTGPQKGNCFVATAAMGSYDHPQVMELRHFRDEWILTKNWGEGFVKWYYHYGEKAAKVIDKSFLLKKISYLLIVKPLVHLSRIVKK